MRLWSSGGEQGNGVQVVERVRRKAAVYGQDITSSSSAPGLENGDSAAGAAPAGCVSSSSHHPMTGYGRRRNGSAALLRRTRVDVHGMPLAGEWQ